MTAMIGELVVLEMRKARQMELADLQVFRTVVEEGGIAAAARKLHRVPSSVTTRVQQLEATLGVRLFVRERQRLHLSAAGERLLEYADRMLRLADEARSAVAGLPGGVLRLGALESTTASRLPAVLGRCLLYTSPSPRDRS